MRFARLFALFLAIYNHSSYAWWDAGHKLVAQIALEQLDSSTRAHLNHLSTTLKKDYPMTHLATWPDEIRKDAINVYTHWHYIDIPYSSDQSPTKMSIDTDNALWALGQLDSILLSPRVKPSERARFTSLLIHIVGDLHQPLHCISRANAALPEGDSGGNLFFVLDPNSNHQRITLHALWDSNLGLFNTLNDERIGVMAHDLMSRYPKESFTAEELNAPPSTWAQEGYQLAIDWVYRTAEEEIPSAYYQKKSRELINQRITLAGYRLALLVQKYAVQQQVIADDLSIKVAKRSKLR